MGPNASIQCIKIAIMLKLKYDLTYINKELELKGRM